MAQTPERRQVARPRRRGDPEDLPARRGLPLPGAASRRALALARRRVGDAGEGHGRTRAASRASVIARVLDATSAGRRAHGRARQQRLLRRPARSRRDARAQGARRPRSSCARTGAPARPSTASAQPSSSAVLEPHEPRSSRERAARRSHSGMLGPEGLTEKATAFSDPELVMAWARGARSGCQRRPGPPARRTASPATDGVEPVGEAPTPGRPARYSTAELIAIEQAALALVERGAGAGAPAVHRRGARPRRAGRLSPEQAGDAAQQSRPAPTASSASSALAGAGKTTATPRSRRGVPSGRRPRPRCRSVRRRRREAPGRDRHSARRPSTGCSQSEPCPSGCRARRRRGRHGGDARCSRRCSSGSSRAAGKGAS